MSGEIQRSSVKEIRQEKKAVDQQRGTFLRTTARCRAVWRSFPVLEKSTKAGKKGNGRTHRGLSKALPSVKAGAHWSLEVLWGKQGEAALLWGETLTEQSPLWLCAWTWESTNSSASQAEFSSVVGKVSWRETQSRKWPKATHEQQGNCKSSGKQKKSRSTYEGSMGGLESGDHSPMKLLSPPNYIFPAVPESPTLPQSSFLVVHPISIPSTLPSCGGLVQPFTTAMAKCFGTPWLWLCCLFLLPFAQPPEISCISFFFFFFPRDGGSCWCVSGYSDQCGWGEKETEPERKVSCACRDIFVWFISKNVSENRHKILLKNYTKHISCQRSTEICFSSHNEAKSVKSCISVITITCIFFPAADWKTGFYITQVAVRKAPQNKVLLPAGWYVSAEIKTDKPLSLIKDWWALSALLWLFRFFQKCEKIKTNSKNVPQLQILWVEKLMGTHSGEKERKGSEGRE